MIVLFTDFGLSGPYTGQVKARLAVEAPGVAVVDLLADAPAFDPQASAYLLATFAPEFPEDAVFVCVVDPGVGGDRRALVVDADGRRFVGPDNGLFELVRRRASVVRVRRIDWRPPRLSASFHGRDLFAPVAARLAMGGDVPATVLDPRETARADWPDDLPAIVYIDVYGNAMTGLRASRVAPDAVVHVAGRAIGRGRTFGDAPAGEALWYENSSGLVEIAVNRGQAGRDLGLRVGTPVVVAAGR